MPMRDCYKLLVAKYIFKGSLCFLTEPFCLSTKYKLKDLKYYTEEKITSFLNFLGSTFQHFLIQFLTIYKAISFRTFDDDYQVFKDSDGKSWQLSSLDKANQPESVIFRTFLCVKYIFMYFYDIHLHPIDWE